MFSISPSRPCLYLTSVTKDRLPVFRTDAVKTIVCAALDEARKSAGFALLAYVIMLDHLHWITDSERTASDVLKFVNGIASRRVIDYLKEQGYVSSLEKLRHCERARRYRYSLWQHHPNARLLPTENVLWRRVHYTHNNPVRAGFVDKAVDYRWSSVRCWNGQVLEDEPLRMDLDRILLRKR
ncbi:MAG TPA: transposase [Acidobacteriota bacterium]|jgi:REP element-mobilizing transposase RayT